MQRIEYFVLPSIPMSFLKYGWGNGYVALPEDHPWYKQDLYNPEIEMINIHGGITYCDFGKNIVICPEKYKDMWLLGFDTGHYGDDETRWSKEKVIEETKQLYIEAVIRWLQSKK